MPAAPPRSPIAQSPVSALLFAFNAGALLEEVVTAWNDYLAGLSRPYEILLINDGSSDDTGVRAERLTGLLPCLRVHHHEQHSGPGAVLRTGLTLARHQLLVTAPCDKQFQPADLYRLLESIDQVDLVTAFRVGTPVPALLKAVTGLRRLLTRILLGAAEEASICWLGWRGWRRRWLARWVFGLKVQDPECFYRLYRREIFERIAVQCNSSVVHIEILAKANHLECVMAEVPATWTPPNPPNLDPIERSAGQELRQLFFAPWRCWASYQQRGRLS